MKSVVSWSLELQMQLANLATSTAASAARTFQFWPMAHIKSWDTSKVSSISPVTSHWHWRHQAGGYWTLRETLLVRERAGAPKGVHSLRSSSHSWSGVSSCWGSDCGSFWSSGCQVTSPCEGVVAGWSDAIGRVLQVGSSAVVAIYVNCQPSEHRRNMVSGRGVGWFFPFFVSTYPCSLAYCCCALVDHFERDVPLASFRACLVGWRRMGTATLNLRSANQKFGCWYGHGKGPHFDVFMWRCWTDSAPILLWRLPSTRKFLMLLVPIHLLCLCMGVHMCWQRLLQAIWEVDTVRSSWNTLLLISGWWSVASSGQLRLCLRP